MRLQFVPAKNPTTIMGVQYNAAQELPYWTFRRFTIEDFVASRSPPIAESGALTTIVSLAQILFPCNRVLESK